MTFGEIISKAAVNTLLGMGTVFFMLVLIIFVISLFRFIPDGRGEKQGESGSGSGASDGQKGIQTSQISQNISAPVPGSPEDPLLIPVIMAALAAAMGEDEAAAAAAIADGTCPYTVRSIRRRYRQQ